MKKFLKAERQLFLRLCVPGSGVLSKNEKEQIAVLRNNDVTYLKLLAAVETAQKELTELQKHYADKFSLSNAVSSSVEEQSSSVVECMNEDYYNDEEDMLDAPILL